MRAVKADCMIGKLRGVIDEVEQSHLILDVNGVGYIVFASAKTLLAMPPSGGQASLFTETHVREDHIHLYGFANREERAWFKLLTTVQGVGAKMALAILSMFSGYELARMIGAQDKQALTAASGVGPKLAERMITELKNKVHAMPGAFGEIPAPAKKQAGGDVSAGGKKKANSRKKSAASKGVAGDAAPASEHPPAPDIAADAVSALAHLGYARADAFAAVSRHLHQAPDAALDDLIKQSLKELAA
jgi:Holliday junction DNA helicase RuvA